jgi:hypothetical protein
MLLPMPPLPCRVQYSTSTSNNSTRNKCPKRAANRTMRLDTEVGAVSQDRTGLCLVPGGHRQPGRRLAPAGAGPLHGGVEQPRVDGDALGGVVGLVDAHQAVRQLEHIVSAVDKGGNKGNVTYECYKEFLLLYCNTTMAMTIVHRHALAIMPHLRDMMTN